MTAKLTYFAAFPSTVWLSPQSHCPDSQCTKDTCALQVAANSAASGRPHETGTQGFVSTEKGTVQNARGRDHYVCRVLHVGSILQAPSKEWRSVRASRAGCHRTDHANLRRDSAILATAHDELRRTVRRLVTSLQIVCEHLGEHGGASGVIQEAHRTEMELIVKLQSNSRELHAAQVQLSLEVHANLWLLHNA